MIPTSWFANHRKTTTKTFSKEKFAQVRNNKTKLIHISLLPPFYTPPPPPPKKKNHKNKCFAMFSGGTEGENM